MLGLNDPVRAVVSYVILVYCKISSNPAESYATEEVTTVSNLISKVLSKLNNTSLNRMPGLLLFKISFDGKYNGL